MVVKGNEEYCIQCVSVVEMHSPDLAVVTVVCKYTCLAAREAGTGLFGYVFLEVLVLFYHWEVMMMRANYLVSSWQGLLQMVVYLVGRGYEQWHVTHLPVEKKDKFSIIDNKLIGQYQTDKTKYQRNYSKEKGFANFVYLRWEHVVIILHTNGTIPESILVTDRDGSKKLNDNFYNIDEKALQFRVSDNIAFEIKSIQKKGQRKKDVSVQLTNDVFKGIKRELKEVASTRNKYEMIKHFDRLNGLPAWAGINQQKGELKSYLYNQAKDLGVFNVGDRKQSKEAKQKFMSSLRLHTRRKVYKVWQSDSTNISSLEED